MSRTFTHSLAAFAAIFLTLSSIGTVITVPPAQAHVSPDFPVVIELA
ncbi:hypothetical protein [Erythrobacter ani]|uniref:Uncharacterized protein n=1 Tax=Erythrobacter ani TaxID=2827235 RepID=A0ABS6SLH0_9SPHN|nr:hypothetical protein [Erythrobacter ani]MBV7265870.1 hypothetical protein [Erythrobacter ani]